VGLALEVNEDEKSVNISWGHMEDEKFIDFYGRAHGN